MKNRRMPWLTLSMYGVSSATRVAPIAPSPVHGRRDRVRDRHLGPAALVHARGDAGRADHHRGRRAAVGDDVDPLARAQRAGAVGDPALHRAQRLLVDVGVVQDPRVEHGGARDARHDLPELVLDRVVGGEHDQADRRARRDPAVELEGHVLAVDPQRLFGGGHAIRLPRRDDPDLDQELRERELRLDAGPRRGVWPSGTQASHSRVHLVERADVGQPDGGHQDLRLVAAALGQQAVDRWRGWRASGRPTSAASDTWPAR